MSRKTFFIILGLLIVIGILVFWFLFHKKPEEVKPLPTETEKPCLIFQSDDPLRPCYIKPSIKPSTTTPQVITSPCDLLNTIERSECITNIAKEKNDKTVCATLTGSFERTICEIETTEKTEEKVDTSILPKASVSVPIKTTIKPPSLPDNIFSSGADSTKIPDSIQKMIDDVNDRLENPDPSITPEGFYDRIATLENLGLFSIVPLQTKPGSSAKAMGAGFSKTENTVHIGSSEISNLSSSDGMTISFAIPASLSYGTHEVWITNDRGSSRNSKQKIQVIISSNPKPSPEITSVTPTNPSYTDTITLHGNNLSGITEVSTSLGSAGKSLSFKPANLPFAKYVIESPQLKNQIVPVYVYVVTDAGFNPEPFIFNVQF